MNEASEALIRELADKLGTTVEHLWSVLVYQAPITGTVDLMVMVACLAAVAWGFFFVRSRTDQLSNCSGDGRVGLWGIWAVITAIVVAVVGSSLSTSIGAIVNPEYWALMQLMP